MLGSGSKLSRAVGINGDDAGRTHIGSIGDKLWPCSGTNAHWQLGSSVYEAGRTHISR